MRRSYMEKQRGLAAALFLHESSPSEKGFRGSRFPPSTVCSSRWSGPRLRTYWKIATVMLQGGSERETGPVQAPAVDWTGGASQLPFWIASYWARP